MCLTAECKTMKNSSEGVDCCMQSGSLFLFTSVNKYHDIKKKKKDTAKHKE